jgi:hypothetical protein
MHKFFLNITIFYLIYKNCQVSKTRFEDKMGLIMYLKRANIIILYFFNQIHLKLLSLLNIFWTKNKVNIVPDEAKPYVRVDSSSTLGGNINSSNDIQVLS